MLSFLSFQRRLNYDKELLKEELNSGGKHILIVKQSRIEWAILIIASPKCNVD